MVYSKTKTTIKKSLEFLHQLLNADAEVVFETDNPHMTAYFLREAIYASQFHPEYKEFEKLREMYSFSVQPGRVVAYRTRSRRPTVSRVVVNPLGKAPDRIERKKARQTEDPPKISHSEKPEESKPHPMEAAAREVAEAVETAELAGVRSLTAILEMTLTYGRKSKEIYYPDATDLSQEDLKRLWRWCEEYEWKIIWQEDKGLTLTKKEVPNDIVWSPDSGVGESGEEISGSGEVNETR